MMPTNEKLKKRKIIKQKNISEIINKPWAMKVLSQYLLTENGEKVHSFTYLTKIMDTSNKTAWRRLNAMCDVGLLRRVKNGEGYSHSKKFPLYYIFKFEDMRLIQDCPVESIYSMVMPHKETKEGMVNVRCLSIYGLKKSNSGLENIIEPLLGKLRHYIDSMHIEEFRNIVNDECLKIKDEYMMQLIKNWHEKLCKNTLLHPLRIRDEIEPANFQFNVPEEHREEFKEITERLWSKFYKECPPIGIMLRF